MNPVLRVMGMRMVLAGGLLKPVPFVPRMHRVRAGAIIRKAVAVWLPAVLARKGRRAKVKNN